MKRQQAGQGLGKIQRRRKGKVKIRKGNERREMEKAEGQKKRAQLCATEEESEIKHWANMNKQDITTNLKRKGQRVKVILIVSDPMKC